MLQLVYTVTTDDEEAYGCHWRDFILYVLKRKDLEPKGNVLINGDPWEKYKVADLAPGTVISVEVAFEWGTI